MGVTKFDWAKSGSKIVPGAICEHLTSFGGMIQAGMSHSLLVDFLRHGAAGASGTVIEPYALQEKFPFPTIQVHYTKGCSLAESFYQSVFGPFHLLIVGDPLCQPWATIPKIGVRGVSSGEKVKGKITLTPSAIAGKVSNFELFIDGIRTQRCRAGSKFEIDTLKLSDGYHEIRVVGIDDSLVQVQGRKIIPIVVNNHNLNITFTGPVNRIKVGQKIELKVNCPGAQQIFVTHMMTKLGQLSGDKGVIQVDTSKISHGTIQLQARAIFVDKDNKKSGVVSRPVVLAISE